MPYSVDDIPVSGSLSSSYQSLGSSLGSSDSGGLFGSLGSLFGSSDSSGLSGQGWAGLVMSGLGAVMSANSDKKSTQKQRDLQRELVRDQGDELRKSALYGAMLNDYYGQKNKYRKYSAASNYAAYGKTLNPQGALGSMVNFNSPYKPQDPGVAPPSPQPLFDTRKGASWNYTNQPLYSFDANGQLISNPAPTTPKKGP